MGEFLHILTLTCERILPFRNVSVMFTLTFPLPIADCIVVGSSAFQTFRCKYKKLLLSGPLSSNVFIKSMPVVLFNGLKVIIVEYYSAKPF